MRFSWLVSIFILHSLTVAASEDPPWKKVSGLSFAGEKVGLTIHEGGDFREIRGPLYFEFDTSSGLMRPLNSSQYKAAYSSAERSVNPKLEFGAPPPSFRTSSGEDVRTEYTECEAQEEGGPICKGVFVILKEKKIPLQLSKQCPYSCGVLVAERWDDLLWVGLGSLGEYGWYGSGYQAYDLRSSKLIHQSKFSDDFLPLLIQKRPGTREIWVAGQGEIRIVDLKSNSVRRVFITRQFDGKSGAIALEASKVKKEDNLFAELAVDLKIPDEKAFYDAVKSFSEEAQMSYAREAHRGKSGRSERFNVLIPFLLKAAAGDDRFARSKALQELCYFDDARAAKLFMEERRKLSGDGSNDAYTIKRCFDRFGQAGLIPRESAESEKQRLLNQLKDSLSRIRAAAQREIGAGPKNEQVVVDNALSLKKLGDSSGLEAINDFFKTATGTPNERELYEKIGQTMQNEDGVMPAIVAGLENGASGGSSYGCMYLNRRHSTGTRKGADTRYAEAILSAVSRYLRSGRSIGPRRMDEFTTEFLKTCTQAFLSELSEPSVSAAFKSRSKNLAPDLKAISDQMAQGRLPELEPMRLEWIGAWRSDQVVAPVFFKAQDKWSSLMSYYFGSTSNLVLPLNQITEWKIWSEGREARTAPVSGGVRFVPGCGAEFSLKPAESDGSSHGHPGQIRGAASTGELKIQSFVQVPDSDPGLNRLLLEIKKPYEADPLRIFTPLKATCSRINDRERLCYFATEQKGLPIQGVFPDASSSCFLTKVIRGWSLESEGNHRAVQTQTIDTDCTYQEDRPEQPIATIDDRGGILVFLRSDSASDSNFVLRRWDSGQLRGLVSANAVPCDLLQASPSGSPSPVPSQPASPVPAAVPYAPKLTLKVEHLSQSFQKALHAAQGARSAMETPARTYQAGVPGPKTLAREAMLACKEIQEAAERETCVSAAARVTLGNAKVEESIIRWEFNGSAMGAPFAWASCPFSGENDALLFELCLYGQGLSFLGWEFQYHKALTSDLSFRSAFCRFAKGHDSLSATFHTYRDALCGKREHVALGAAAPACTRFINVQPGGPPRRELVPEALCRLFSRDGSNQGIAASYLGRFVDPVAAEALHEYLLHHSPLNPEAAKKVIGQLVDWKDLRIFDTLSRMLEQRSRVNAQIVSIRGFTILRDRRAMPLLRELQKTTYGKTDLIQSAIVDLESAVANPVQPTFPWGGDSPGTDVRGH